MAIFILMKKFLSATWLLLTSILIFESSSAQSISEIKIFANQPDKHISPNMWGIFFEDINFAADGGIYAELVKNRSFEFSNPTMAWTENEKNGGSGQLLIQNRGALFQENPRYASVYVKPTGGNYSISNEGFRGMGIKANNEYEFSIWAKRTNGDLAFSIHLINEKGESIASSQVVGFGNEWKKITSSFKSTQTEAKAHLELRFSGSGSMDFDMVSLFPKDTWKGRPGGLRKDLVQLLSEAKMVAGAGQRGGN